MVQILRSCLRSNCICGCSRTDIYFETGSRHIAYTTKNKQSSHENISSSSSSHKIEQKASIQNQIKSNQLTTNTKTMKVSPSTTNTNNATTQTKSVLMIGASGRTGNHIIEALSESSSADIDITAFCRDPTKLSKEIHDKCTHVVTGNARNKDDLLNALVESNADTVIIAIGNGDDVSKTNIRTKSAQALVDVLENDPEQQFRHVRVLVVSSIGAGNSNIKVGFGIGKMIEFHLRHILKDHDGQELAFQSIKNRVMIVRPTGLTDDDDDDVVKKGENQVVKMVTFGNNEKSPTIQTNRKNLAEWLVTQIIEEKDVSFGSKPVNVTCVV